MSKRFVSALFFLLGFLFFQISFCQAYNATGIWNYQESGHVNNCPGDNPVPGNGVLGIYQTGGSFLIIGDDFSSIGTVNGSTYSYDDSFCEESGTTSGTATVTLTSETSGAGTVSWTYTESGWGSCSGSYNITITKQAQLTPTYDAAGRWNFNQSSFTDYCGDSDVPRSSGYVDVTQVGNLITAIDDLGESYNGFVTGNTIYLVWTSLESGGRVSEVYEINLTSSTEGTGSAWFVWDDDCDDCWGEWSISISNSPVIVNANGMSDIVIRHTNGNTWKYLMNGHTIDTMAPIATIDPAFDIVGVADITGDSKADIVLKSDSYEMIWYADGVTNKMNQMVQGLPAEWPVAAVVDFNGDGTNDILIQNTNTGVLWLYYVENGAIVENGNFIGGLEPGWIVVGAGDINGDGMSDIVIRHTSGNTWKYLMNGHTIDSMAPIADIEPAFDVVGVADITGDQKADIVLKSDSLEMIWYADGVTNVMALIVQGLPTEWPVAAVAGFNADGTNDILIQNTNTGVLWLYYVENGAIVENGNFIGGLESGWTVVGAGDINGDGISAE